MNKLVCLQKQAKIASNWLHLFDGQHCRFSSRFLRTLSEFGLHNMIGTDKGIEMASSPAILSAVCSNLKR